MTNRFFTNTFNPALGSLARSPSVAAVAKAIQDGFDAVQAELDGLGGRGSKIQNISNVTPTPVPLRYFRWNAAGTDVEFVSGSKVDIKTISAAEYTLLASDAGLMLETTSASPVTITVPTNATAAFQPGDIIPLAQVGAGQVTLVPAPGVTISSTDNALSTRMQNAQIALIYRGGDLWRVIGERSVPSIGVALLAAANVFTRSQAVTPVALTDGATINTDASLSNTFLVALGGNRTMANPTGLVDGAIYTWHIQQDGTGGRTLTWGSKFKFPGGSAPVLTTAANKVDIITGQYIAGADVIRMGSLLKGYD